MARAGADAIIAHVGLTVGGSIGLAGDDALSLEKAPAVVQAIGDAATRIKPDVMLLCHGGPIATPKDAAYVLERCDAVGFVGASSMERLPVENAIAETTRAFKAVSTSRLYSKRPVNVIAQEIQVVPLRAGDSD